MGLSSSKQKSTSDSKSTETGTRTPINPLWVTDAVQNLVGQIGEYGQTDPYSHVAPPSPLQQAAWAGAGALGGWKDGLQQAAGLAGTASGANLAAATSYQAPKLGAPPQGAAAGYGASLLGEAGKANVDSYSAPQLGGASGYDPGKIGTASSYSIAQLGAAPQVSAQGYAASTITPEQIAANRQAAAQRGSDFMGAYLNPYTQQVVDTTLADFDHEAGEVRAQQSASAARNGAFSGSRYGVREAATEGELARSRASTAAGLRSNAFNTAAALGMQDADRFTNVDMFNTGQTNSRNIAQTQINQEGNIYNATAHANADRHLAETRERAAAANAQLTSEYDLARFNAQTGANRYASDVSNRDRETQYAADERAARYSSDMANQFRVAQHGADTEALKYNTDISNQVEREFEATRNRFRENNLAAINTAGQANSAAANQFGLANLELLGNYGLEQVRMDERAGQYNAGAAVDLAKFNAGQTEAAEARRLQAAQVLGQLAQAYGGEARADLGLTAEMGQQQWQLAETFAQAPMQQLAALSQLYGSAPLNLFNGQQMDGKMTSRGTEVTKTTPSLFSQLLAAAQTAASFGSGG